MTGVSGGVDSEARFDAARGQVYLGADDGSFYAVDPGNGKIRWSYQGKGAIERPAEIGGDLVYVGSAADRVVALEPATGKWRWQYERDMPEGFTIHGYAGPRLRGAQLLVGLRRRILRVAGGGERRGRVGEVARRGVRPVRRRRFDARVSATTSPTSPRTRAASTRWTRATAACAGGWESRASAT